MKGKWKIKKYIIVFILIFTIVLKMPLESVGTEVLAAERETIQEEIAADPVYTISGSITANSVKVEGAFISVEGHDGTAETNEQGEYSISGLCPGEYTLIVSKEGFEQRKISITVMEGEKEEIQPIEPIELGLKKFVISANTQEIFVNESLQFFYISELPESEIKAIEWKTADSEILDIDEKGKAIGKKTGNTSVAATFYTKYGLWISEQVSVTVNLRPVKLSLAVEPPDPGADQRVREIVLRAGITDNEGRPLDEGEVLFTVIRAADGNLGEPESIQTYTAEVKAGEAAYTLRKNKIDFYGTYTFTARYTGVENKYSESDETAQSYNYTTDPIKFFDEKGEEISSTEENPLQVTYGNTESVYLKNEDNIEYSAQLRNDSDGAVKIAKQEASDKEGYTEFVINTQKTCKSAITVTFIKTDISTNETLYTNFYVQVNPREIEIDEGNALMKYSKIYDKDLTVTHNGDTKDEVTFIKMPILQSEEGGIVYQDDIYVDLETVPQNFQGRISADLENVTGTEGIRGEIKFNEAQLTLRGTKAENYVLTNKEITVSAIIVIHQRPVDIRIRDAEREFGHGIDNSIDNEPSYQFYDESHNPSDTWMEIEKADKTIAEGLLEADKFDIPACTTIMKEQLPEGNLTKPGKFESALTIDIDQLISRYEFLQNYEITVRPGNLEIMPEKISDGEDYLNLDPSDYPENTTMYISEGDKGKSVWVKADNGRLNLYANPGKLYNDVILLKVQGKAINGTAGVSLTAEGYTFNKEQATGGQDIELTLKMRRNPVEGEDSGNIADSEEFSYDIRLDGNIPEVAIDNIRGEATVIDKLWSAITFGNFGKETYYARISVTDELSGLKLWHYAVLPLDRDIENGKDLEAYIETLIDKSKKEGDFSWSDPIREEVYEIPVVRENPGQEDFVANNYVILVKPFDHVENGAVYTSMGIILDINEPFVEINLAEGQEQKDIYNGSVDLTVTVRDTKRLEGGAVSGIQKVTYKAAIGEDNLEKTEDILLFERDKDKTYSLEELEKELQRLFLTVDKERFNSNDVWVKATAWDNSGNGYSTVKRLKIDTVKPEVQVKYETEASEDYAPYYNNERTAVITVKERNVNLDNADELYFDLKREQDSKPVRYHISALEALDGITAEVVKDTQKDREPWEFTDERILEIRVCFENDDKYDFDVNCTDGAGWQSEENNQSYFVIDKAAPVMSVSYKNLRQPQNGIFNEDVILQIDVEDSYTDHTYSGLKRIWYTISASENVNVSDKIELLNNSGSKERGRRTFSQIITVPADVYNSNDVKVQAFAVDSAGNRGESEITELKIDVTNPAVSVSWDLDEPMNGRYYKDTRTATVTVTDRNFDPDNVRFNIINTDGTEASISEWSGSPDIGLSDSSVSTCQVVFSADGDYTFTLSCEDLAGNRTEYSETEAFTIDKTVPEISVSYDNNSAKNGNFYNKERTATITIREHNFNEADVRAAITASLKGKEIFTPSISEFSGKDDVHKATVTYGTDGDYTFDVDYTDMAGNPAAEYIPDQFTLDLTEPVIEILEVEDRSANNGVVSPEVRVTDINYEDKNVTVTITGANTGKADIENAVSEIENGQIIKFKDFPRQEKTDDLYTLTAKAVDRAGNEKTETILFSVNRYGSVYVMDHETRDWLSIEKYAYISQEKEVGVIEYNVDTVKESQILVNRDGELKNLKAGEDYEVTDFGTKAQWKARHYVLKAENFETEGNYSVIFSTKDEAGNAMNNTSVKRKGQNLPIEFAVDKTAPTIVITGVEDGGSYRSAERTMTVDAKDNLALNEVRISINGERQTYKAEELAESDGVIHAVISSARHFQEIEITASDAAGNLLGQGGIKDRGRPVILRVLVTPNAKSRHYMNKYLCWGAVMGVLSITGVSIFLAVRKNRKDN